MEEWLLSRNVNRRWAEPIDQFSLSVCRAIWETGEQFENTSQLATNTYNAYTNWGGHSLYSYHDRDGLQGHRVSFDRPITSQFEKLGTPVCSVGGE